MALSALVGAVGKAFTSAARAASALNQSGWRSPKPGDWIEVRIDGLEEINKALVGLGDALGKQILDRSVLREAKAWAARASVLAPEGVTEWHWVGRVKAGKAKKVYAGNLKRNIKVKRLTVQSWARKTDSYYGVFVPAIAYYWRFVEFGVDSRGIPARPFLRTAFDELHMEGMLHIAADASRFIRIYLLKQNRATMSKDTYKKMMQSAWARDDIL